MNLSGCYLQIRRATLRSWKSAISDDPSSILETWVGQNVCSYKEIYRSDGTVARIDLNHANLRGTLIFEQSLLTDLTIIHLNSNRFHGAICETFKDLVSLQELDLSNNQFSGNFPIPLLYIPNLPTSTSNSTASPAQSPTNSSTTSSSTPFSSTTNSGSIP
ncbi:Leucine-rich repeat extensin-like protein 4 [Linum perenne]